MWIPHYIHPLFSEQKRDTYRKRWTDPETHRETKTFERVTALIKEGAGEGFLNHDFFRGNLPGLDDDLDLKGLKIWEVELEPERGDTFKGMSFDYSEVWHSKFKKVVFLSCRFNFARFYNCIFEDCSFVFTHFVGATFEKCQFIRCDFAEPCNWENGMFKNTQFDGCFLGERTPFSDCYFDDQTTVFNMAPQSFHFGEKVRMKKEALAGYYASFQAAYEASGADDMALDCYWRGRQAFSRHNLSRARKLRALANEWLTGYGLRPFRPLLALLALYFVATLVFWAEMPLKESMVFSAGGLFTFGAGSEHFKDLGYPGTIFYVSLAFFGITLTALFVTCVASLAFRAKIPAKTIKTIYS